MHESQSSHDTSGPRVIRHESGGRLAGEITPSALRSEYFDPAQEVDVVTILLIEPDERVAREIQSVINARIVELDVRRHDPAFRHLAESRDRSSRFVIHTVIRSLAELHHVGIDDIDAALCSAVLPDGSGLDALAFLRRSRRDLPVILTGMPCDSALAVEAVRSGAQDFVVVTSPYVKSLPMVIEKGIAHHRIREENERLHTDLSRSLAELAVKNQQMQTMIRQLETMARTDELTGAANRRWLNLMLEGHWADAMRNDLPLAFMMIDLDGFKGLNDAMGHLVGDEILRMAAKVIDANCRDVDITARYGGDEFCVLMPHTSPEDAAVVAQRVHSAFVTAASRRPAAEPRVGVSIGVSHVDLSRPRDLAEFVRHADEALYAAKSAGKQLVMVRGTDGPFSPNSPAVGTWRDSS
jgi:diguanylate cyclase (GGDEF)-like protein